MTNCTQNIRSSIFNTMLVLMSLIKQYKELLHLNAHNLPAFFVYINTLVFLCLCVYLCPLRVFSEVESGFLSLFLWIFFVLHVLSIFAVNGHTKLVRRNLKGYYYNNAVKLFFFTIWYSFPFHFNKIAELIRNMLSFKQLSR